MRVFACLLLHPCSHRECSLQAAEPIVPLELPGAFCISVFLHLHISAFCVSVFLSKPLNLLSLTYFRTCVTPSVNFCISAFLYYCISVFLYFCSSFSKIIFAIAYFFISVLLYFSPSRWTYCPLLASAPMYLLPDTFCIFVFLYFCVLHFCICVSLYFCILCFCSSLLNPLSLSCFRTHVPPSGSSTGDPQRQPGVQSTFEAV